MDILEKEVLKRPNRFPLRIHVYVRVEDSVSQQSNKPLEFHEIFFELYAVSFILRLTIRFLQLKATYKISTDDPKMYTVIRNDKNVQEI